MRNSGKIAIILYMNLLETTVYTVGHYGPIIVFCITLYQIWFYTIFLYAFIIGTYFNYTINEHAKIILKQPRPDNQIKFIDHEQLIGLHKYGMPSAHSQSVWFSTTFLYLVKHTSSIFYITLVIGVITLFQRWKMRRHSVEQLATGFCIGSVFAYFTYYCAKTVSP